MLEAITYDLMIDNIKKNINENGVEAATIGILLARPKSKAGKDIVDTLPYYHHRSGQNINFYLPGYGAYWCGVYPDERNVVTISRTQWSFSNQEYVHFIDDIENNSSWHYSGESELLLIEYRYNQIEYANVLCFHLDTMLRDEVIPSIDIFFEGIFRAASPNKSVTEISDMSGLKTLGQVTIDSLLKATPQFFSGVIKKGRHYILKDYTK